MSPRLSVAALGFDAGGWVFVVEGATVGHREEAVGVLVGSGESEHSARVRLTQAVIREIGTLPSAVVVRERGLRDSLCAGASAGQGTVVRPVGHV